MPKFSIIVPVFNVEKYITKCLDSVRKQTFSDFECILVCDKSSDGSNNIVKEYLNKYDGFKMIYRENTGLSEARNIGVEASNGQYLLFLDADDYIEVDLLNVLNQTISNEDLIRFQVREVYESKMIDWNEINFEGTGIECFDQIIKFHYVENAWSYCYNATFFKDNNFHFMKDCLAEDYGLIPLVIAKASKVKIISYIGYYYLQRSNSLMSNKNYNHKLKKMDDILRQANFLYEELKCIPNNDVIMKFINNSIIYFATTLKYRDYLKYSRILKKMHIYDYIDENNNKQKFKKFLIKNNAYIFYNYLMRLI